MEAGTVTTLLTRRIILGAFLAALLVLGYRVLAPFLVPVAWALILVYVTWPVYRRVRTGLRQQPATSALVMTLFLCAVFAVPVLWVVVLLRTQLPAGYQLLAGYLAQGPPSLPAPIAHIPWLGPELQHYLDQLSGDRTILTRQLVQWAEPRVRDIASVLGDIGLNVFKIVFALFTAFFFYRDGDRLHDQTRRVLLRFLGERAQVYLDAIADTTRAVLYGLILTALAQGLLAGLGYWQAGVPAPALLGAITVIFAFIPFGPPFIWGLVGVGLLLSDHTLAGIGLLLWGTIVVSQIDNLIRPMVISSATRIPFLLVLFGVLGGIGAFGLVGLFLGPVVVAVLLAVWREWLEEQAIPAASDSAENQDQH